MFTNPRLQRILGVVFTATPLSGIATMALDIPLITGVIVGLGITGGINFMIMGALREMKS